MKILEHNESVVGPAAYSPEWYEIRFYDPGRSPVVLFGASEAAAACNVSPYMTALELFLEKRGSIEPNHSKPEESERLEIGKALEPAILKLYQSRVGNIILGTECPLHISCATNFVGATPDAIAVDADSNSWLVDAKSSSFFMTDKTGENEHRYGADGTDEVPLTNLFQAQQQMYVMGADRVDFPVLLDNRQLRIYRVPRSDELIATIVDAEKELAERIINNDPPEPNYEHKSTKRLLNEMFGCEVGTVREFDQTHMGMLLTWEHLNGVIRKAEAHRDEIKNRIAHNMGDRQLSVPYDNDGPSIKRVAVAPSYWTDADVEDVRRKVGTVKRAGHTRMIFTSERKIL